jgi:general secretion pathway protein D
MSVTPQIGESEAVTLNVRPTITRVREFVDDESVPGFSEVPGVGELFKFRDRQQVKTELVIFLRPTVIRSPDIGRDFSSFQRYLPKNIQDNEALPSLVNPFSQN